MPAQELMVNYVWNLQIPPSQPSLIPCSKHSQIHLWSSEESLINNAGMLKLARTDSSAFAAEEDGIQACRAGVNR